MSISRTPRLIVPALAMLVAACSDGVGGDRTPLTLTFSTQTSAAASASRAPLGDLISVSAGGNTVVVTKAQMVLDEIELKTAAASCAEDVAEDHQGDGGDDDDDCPKLRLDPVLVDLPIDAMTQLDLGAVVPAGTYRELEFEMDAVEVGERASAAAFIASHPDFRNVSIRIEGTFNGAPFVFTSREDAELELEFEPAITVSSGSANVTVKIDVTAWFKDSFGNAIDPRQSGNASIIMNNIKHSFHAFEDRDRDGDDDHSGRG